jgi:hypothetical protein
MVIDERGSDAHPYPFTYIAFSSPRALAVRLDQLRRKCGCQSNDPTVDAFIMGLARIYKIESGRELTYFVIYDVEGGPSGNSRRAIGYEWWTPRNTPPEQRTSPPEDGTVR